MDNFLIFTPDGGAREVTGTYVIRGGILIIDDAEDDEAGPEVYSPSGWVRVAHTEAVEFDYVTRKFE